MKVHTTRLLAFAAFLATGLAAPQLVVPQPWIVMADNYHLVAHVPRNTSAEYSSSKPSIEKWVVGTRQVTRECRQFLVVADPSSDTGATAFYSTKKTSRIQSADGSAKRTLSSWPGKGGAALALDCNDKGSSDLRVSTKGNFSPPQLLSRAGNRFMACQYDAAPKPFAELFLWKKSDRLPPACVEVLLISKRISGAQKQNDSKETPACSDIGNGNCLVPPEYRNLSD